VEKKGFDVLVDAVAILKSEDSPLTRDLTVTFVGEGDRRDEIEKQIQSLGLQDTITLTGPQDSDAVRAHMECATVMCAPCLIGEDGNRDALPTVLLEALARGLPCISTPVTGIPEILDHGRAGIIVPERDAQATADAVRELLADSERRKEIARVGRLRAEKLFDRRETSGILDAWFNEVVTGKDSSCASPA
jgi:glycosyltransferase involved in cell wall biosynthesis